MTGDIGLLDFAVDTLVGTGVLIAAALVLRRPVARWFGPRAAYALWLLPLIRLMLPPLVLPAWMRPADPVAGGAGRLRPSSFGALPLGRELPLVRLQWLMVCNRGPRGS